MFDELRAAMIEVGIDPAEVEFIPDGRLRRFRLPEDRAKGKSGWLVLHDNGDNSFGAAFGSWKALGSRHTWHSRVGQQNNEGRAEFVRRMAEARQRASEEQKARHAEAAAKAARLWRRSKPADYGHPYLIRKQVKPFGIRQLGDSLVVAVRNSDGVMTGLQFIHNDGSKRFIHGTAVSGCYHAIGKKPLDVLLIAEGYATAATLHEATGHPCTVAFFAGNLRPVALSLRTKYPKIKIILCADADEAGRNAADEAAKAVDGIVIEPSFSKELPHG